MPVIPSLSHQFFFFFVNSETRNAGFVNFFLVISFVTGMTMENSFFSHRSLMKRRYSVPETVMRKHNLQAVALRKQISDSVVPKMSSSSSLETTLHETCQTYDASPVHEHSWIDGDQKLVASSRKNSSRNRKRKSYRLLRKSNSSYCQYRYTMSAFNRQLLTRRGTRTRNSHSSQNHNEPIENDDRVNSLKYAEHGNVELEANQSPVNPNNELNVGFLAGTKSAHKRLPEIKPFPACPQRTIDLIPKGCEESSKRTTTEGETTLQNLHTWKTDFPLIVQSQSVFLHPSQTGCSTRETHSISIEISPPSFESRCSEINLSLIHISEPTRPY